MSIQPYYDRYGVTVHHGNCLDVLAQLPDASVHAVTTDPPYELGFMGKGWDRTGIAYDVDLWRECLRVLKPGGHLLAFGGSRTWHRLAAAVEDAGFELRDSIAWLYATGFPKSLDVSKAIDKAACRPAVDKSTPVPISGPVTEEAKRWRGFGTAVKPAFEPIVVARKPITGTVAANVLEYGTGALNIDGCRVQNAERHASQRHDAGRWPTNVVLTHAATPDGVDLCVDGCVPGCVVAELDEQSGNRPGFSSQTDRAPNKTDGSTTYGAGIGNVAGFRQGYNDAGGASRFFPVFRFNAKAPTRERPRVHGVSHPTIKPVALMRWLVRLVTPPTGVVLDPFLGSGTTAEAARVEGFQCVGMEREETYLPLIRQRLDGDDGDDLFGGAA